MLRSRTLRAAVVLVGAALVASMAACSSPDDNDTAAPRASQSSAPSSSPSGDSMGNAPFGAACASVPADTSNPGSFAGMAKDPVATAATNNPALSTLVAAVTAAGLVDTLNSATNITVFAPTNDAFAKIPKADLDNLLKPENKDMLTKILTYHVVGQKITPGQLATAGPFTTLQGGQVTASGSGENLTVGPAAKVVCGNVQTANATVYLIDTVLMPG